MADDRPIEDPAEAIGRITKDFDDFKATILARMSVRPTGDIEETLRSTPKPGTLICNGQLVSRTTYSALWTWAQANSLVVAGLFTNGDGSTTFGLPDFRGRVMRGTPNGEAVGLLSGADTKIIGITNLPAHDHNVSISDAGSHNHGSTGAAGGNHGGHFNTRSDIGVPDGSYHFVAPWNGGIGNDAHSHSTSSGGTHDHPVNESTVGSGTAFDVRQASFNGNWLIWY